MTSIPAQNHETADLPNFAKRRATIPPLRELTQVETIEFAQLEISRLKEIGIRNLQEICHLSDTFSALVAHLKKCSPSPSLSKMSPPPPEIAPRPPHPLPSTQACQESMEASSCPPANLPGISTEVNSPASAPQETIPQPQETSSQSSHLIPLVQLCRELEEQFPSPPSIPPGISTEVNSSASTPSETLQIPPEVSPPSPQPKSPKQSRRKRKKQSPGSRSISPSIPTEVTSTASTPSEPLHPPQQVTPSPQEVPPQSPRPSLAPQASLGSEAPSPPLQPLHTNPEKSLSTKELKVALQNAVTTQEKLRVLFHNPEKVRANASVIQSLVIELPLSQQARGSPTFAWKTAVKAWSNHEPLLVSLMAPNKAEVFFYAQHLEAIKKIPRNAKLHPNHFSAIDSLRRARAYLHSKSKNIRLACLHGLDIPIQHKVLEEADQLISAIYPNHLPTQSFWKKMISQDSIDLVQRHTAKK